MAVLEVYKRCFTVAEMSLSRENNTLNLVGGDWRNYGRNNPNGFGTESSFNEYQLRIVQEGRF